MDGNKQSLVEKIGYNKASRLVERWGNYIEVVNSAMNESGRPQTADANIVLAQTLENVQEQIDRAEHLFETTQPADVGPFKKFGLELVSAVVPNLIANDLVSVQPMDHKVGEIRYIKYLYGSDKGEVSAGDEFTSAKEFTGGNFNYSSETVESEYLGADGSTSYEFSLSWTPVRPGTLEITVDGNTLVDDGEGNISGTGLSSGSIEYSTGIVTLEFDSSTGTDLYGDYRANFEDAPVNAPSVQIKIATAPIIAKTRKLKALYSFDAAFDLQKDYGVEINAELVGQTASEIKHEIDGEILNDIFNAANEDISDYSYTAPSGVSRQEHDDAFYNHIVEGGNAIFDRTKRATVNYVILGTGVANIVETMRSFTRSTTTNPVGPHLAGDVNGIPVYKNPFMESNKYIVGYKGDGLFDSGMVYAPYMPVLTTSLVMTEDFTGRRGFATSYGKKVVNNNLYQVGTVTDLP